MRKATYEQQDHKMIKRSRCKLRAFQEQRCVKFQVQGNQMPISPTPICVAADKREQYSLQREWDVRERSGREEQQLLCHCAFSQTGQPIGDTWSEPGWGVLDFLISLSHLHVGEAGGVGCFRPLQACLSGSLLSFREKMRGPGGGVLLLRASAGTLGARIPERQEGQPAAKV